MKRTLWRLSIATSAAVAVLLTAACGNGSSDDDASSGAKVDLSAAQQTIAPLTKRPTKFPITEPLAERPTAGTTVAYLDIGTPVSGQVYGQLKQAAQVLGVTLQRVQTGQSPQDINAAMNTLVESRPAAVIDLAIDPALFTPQLKALQKQGTVFVAQSIVNGEQFGLDDKQIAFGAAGSKANGKVLTSALLAKTDGKATDLAFYNVPELPFSALMLEGAKEQLAEQCSGCELRVVDIPITQVGSTAARTIVSDLQAHPDTEAFIASVDELQIGLPAAMKVAGVDVPGMGLGATPVNLQQIAAGQERGALVADYAMLAWVTMDKALRELAGQKYDHSFWTKANPGVAQVVTEDNVPSDPDAGYIAFPDYKERFTKLWTGR